MQQPNKPKKNSDGLDSTDFILENPSPSGSRSSQTQGRFFLDPDPQDKKHATKVTFSEPTEPTADAGTEPEHGAGYSATAEDNSDPRTEDETTNSSSHDDDEDDVDSDLLDDNEDVRARQNAINRSHLFGLPIWKPALYKKNRSISRAAFMALHSTPKRFKRLILNPGNLFWLILFGFPVGVLIILFAVILRLVPLGGKEYSRVFWELGWYVMWPFGRTVERIKNTMPNTPTVTRESSANLESHSINIDETVSETTVPGSLSSSQCTIPNASTEFGSPASQHSLLPQTVPSYTPKRAGFLGWLVYYTILVVIINPILLLISGLMWLLVVTIPMGILTFTLSKYLWRDPLSLHFRVKHISPVEVSPQDDLSKPSIFDIIFSDELKDQQTGHPTNLGYQPVPKFSSSEPGSVYDDSAELEDTHTYYKQSSNALLCTNEAVGILYYKYTIDGVNIIFINLLFFALFVLFLAFVVRPMTGNTHPLTQPGVLFTFCLVSTIPLAYLIGQAVSSISAQSSLGIGSVINATFGSIIEIILYSLALTQGKLDIVQGALVGSFLAGMLLMPGTSMIAGGIKYKEQKFNAKSAGVTSTLIIMSMIAAFAPTLFYSTFGQWELKCDLDTRADNAKTAFLGKCRQVAIQPIYDPFYLNTVRPFTYICAAILIISYMIGLWFTLRTHTKQIYHSPAHDSESHAGFWNMAKRLITLERQNNHNLQLVHNSNSFESDYNRKPYNNEYLQKSGLRVPQNEVDVSKSPNIQRSLSFAPGDTSSIIRDVANQVGSCSSVNINSSRPVKRNQTKASEQDEYNQKLANGKSCIKQNKQSHGSSLKPPKSGYNNAKDPKKKYSSSGKGTSSHNDNSLPTSSIIPTIFAADPDDQFSYANIMELGKRLASASSNTAANDSNEGHSLGNSQEGGGGHDAPNWSKTKSGIVLCFCTIVFALIAEVLVDTVDVVIADFGVSEKMLGLTLFALVPTVTEFVNASAFAMQKNIALAIEICNAYTVQVFLLQIPVLLFFSAYFQDSIIAHSIAAKESAVAAAASQLASGTISASSKKELAKTIFGHLRPTNILSSALGKFGLTNSTISNHFTSSQAEAATALNQVTKLIKTVSEDKEPYHYIFTLIFSRWEIICSVFSVFLLTYMLIEGKSNYFKGSILCLSYLVWITGFYLAPTEYMV